MAFRNKGTRWPSRCCSCRARHRVSTFLFVDRRTKRAANRHGCRAVQTHKTIKGHFLMTWQISLVGGLTFIIDTVCVKKQSVLTDFIWRWAADSRQHIILELFCFKVDSRDYILDSTRTAWYSPLNSSILPKQGVLAPPPLMPILL